MFAFLLEAERGSLRERRSRASLNQALEALKNSHSLRRVSNSEKFPARHRLTHRLSPRYRFTPPRSRLG